MNHVSTVARRITSLGLRDSTGLQTGLCATACVPRLLQIIRPPDTSIGGSQKSFHCSSYDRITQTTRLSSWICKRDGQGWRNTSGGNVHFRSHNTRWTTRPYAKFTKPKSGKRPKSTPKQDIFGELTEEEYLSSSDAFKPLSTQKIGTIFGPGIALESANELLSTIQKQRITGTLDHDISGPGWHDVLIAKGLQWLRTAYPLDEDAAIIRRIEREEKAEQEYYIRRAEKLGLYKPQASAKSTGNVYGKSGLDSIRAHYKAKLDEQLAAQEAEKKKTQADELPINTDPAAVAVSTSPNRVWLKRPTESAEWVKKYKEAALLSKLQAPPDMSKTRRLLPATIFLAITLGLCALFAQNYIAPPRIARLFPDTPPAAATVQAIIAVNMLITLAWRLPFMWRTLNTFFLMIPATPRAGALLGNVWSHQSPAHLFTNMVILWFVGTRVHDDIGRGNFLALYVGCGVFASYFSLVRFVATNLLTQSSLGASGAVMGIITAFCVLNSEYVLYPDISLNPPPFPCPPILPLYPTNASPAIKSPSASSPKRIDLRSPPTPSSHSPWRSSLSASIAARSASIILRTWAASCLA